MSAPTIITPDEVLDPTVEEVSEGIYAYLQLYGQWGLNNAGFLVGRDAVTVVDTCFTVGRTRRFIETIGTVTDKRLRTLVNTHHHGDHTHGNFAFPDATIVGHELCRQEVMGTGLLTQLLFEPGTDWGDIEIAPPFVTFTDRLDLYVDDLLVEAHFVGPAHTTNDVVYHVPERKLMFAGDLVFSGGTPFVMMGSVEGSLRAYERLRSFDVETVVPGHGPLCGPELFGDMADYLRLIQDAARQAHEAGVDPLTAARDLDLGPFADWHDKERVAGNLHRALSEVRGEPLGTKLDLLPIIADMVAYNDGRMLRCLA
jgi:cyclase